MSAGVKFTATACRIVVGVSRRTKCVRPRHLRRKRCASTAPTSAATSDQRTLATQRVDPRLAENQSGKRRVVVARRERGGRTFAQVFASEADAVGTVRLRIAKGTTVHPMKARPGPRCVPPSPCSGSTARRATASQVPPGRSGVLLLHYFWIMRPIMLRSGSRPGSYHQAKRTGGIPPCPLRTCHSAVGQTKPLRSARVCPLRVECGGSSSLCLPTFGVDTGPSRRIAFRSTPRV